jgi:uncharacterized repeat protein (TIGR01451 family)
MRMQKVRTIGSRLATTLLVVLGWAGVAHAQWTNVSNPGGLNASTCLLLTDGTVMCQQGEQSHNWNRLTPDQNGQYASGVWTPLPSFPSTYGPLYFASAVLANGKVLVIGGEYNTGTPSCTGNPGCDVPQGYILDPSTGGPWTAVTPPSGSDIFGNAWGANVGDGVSIVLPNGTFVVGYLFGPNLAQFNPGTLNFTQLNDSGKADNNSEEGWTLLPDGTFLTVNTGTQGGTGSQIYNPSTVSGNFWTSAGSTVVSLPNNGGLVPAIVPELGPAILRPDGTVVVFGATTHNAVYNTLTKTWSAASDFPLVPPSGGAQMLAADAPASLLPSGNVLVATSTFFGTPTHLFEFDGSNNFNPVADPPNNGNSSFQGRMLLLPTGQVLFTNGTSDLEIYSPGGSFAESWEPTITAGPSNVTSGATNIAISGTQFNGLSQANAYGDDTQTATNYPLVRITNHATSHVFYARTHDHSSMGVATGATIVSTEFDVPTIESGASDLVVVANGIPSDPIVVNGPDLSITKSHSDPFTQGDPGDTFTITVSNVGASATSGLVTVTDALPASLTGVLMSGGGWSCAVPTCTRSDVLAAGASYPPITLTVSVDGAAPPHVINTVTVSGGGEASTVNVTGNDAATDKITILQHTITTVQPATGDYDDNVTLQATVAPAGVTGSVTFVVNGSSVGAGTYDSGSGMATLSYLIPLAAGIYSLEADFTSTNPLYLNSQGVLPMGLKVTLEQTTLSYTGDTVIANGGTATMKGVLLEDNIKPIAGRTVVFTLGTGATQQTCSGVTNLSGVATCPISPVAQPLGPGVVADAFTGDAFYLPASANANTILFAFLTNGAMVTGDLSSPIGAGVTFWGAQWSSLNSVSGGPAPDAFKGFAATLATEPPACGITWTTRPGNSSNPPATLPSYMGVLVSTAVGKSGPTIAGDVLSIVVVQTDAGYAANPGHPGTGTVIAQFCHR